MPPAGTGEVGRELRSFDLLSGATEAQLARLAEECRLLEVSPGEAVVRQGDFGASMFFLIAGSVAVRQRRFDGVESDEVTIVAGRTFGELGLAGDRPRSATVAALTRCRLLEVGREAFSRVFARTPAVMKRLDRAYRRAAIAANLGSDPLFSDLPAAAVGELIEHATMRAYEKDEPIVEQGEEGDAFYIIWSGHARIVQRSPDGAERVFAYVAEGDYVGETALVESRPRTASVIANDHVEAICIARPDFERVLALEPALGARLRQQIGERSAQARAVLSSDTRQLFIADMLRLGAAFAANALVISLKACTRCGECASACHDLYGNSRLTRRGKTFVLPDTHEPILMPNSCWHCRDPECMIGCPTDALRRGPSGEIQVLTDRCIGCEICANRCPWGNISMAEAQPSSGSRWRRWFRRLLGRPRVAELRRPAAPRATAKAVKCDLCHDQPAPACVAACPYGAIERVDPNEFLRRAQEVT